MPADDPESYVVIDWSMGGLAAVGDDLGQPLVGPAHAGELAITNLPRLHEVLLGAYADGLAAESFPATREQIRYGFDGGLLLRSAFTALPWPLLHQPPDEDLAALVEARAELTAYLCGLGLEVVPSP